MATERAAFLTQMVEVLTSTVSFGERLNNMVHLLARNLKVDQALYFQLDKAKETLVLHISSQGPVPPHLRVEFPMGVGLVGETASSRTAKTVHREQPGVLRDNADLEKLNPAFHTMAAFPVADDNYLYGVLILVDRGDRTITTGERHNIELACLMLAATVRQAIVQEEAKKRIAELSVLFEVGKALSSTVELDELLERIVSTTAKVITARGAALHIIDLTTGEPRVSSRYGQIPPVCPALPKVEATTGPSGAEPPHFEGQAADADGLTHYCLAVPLTFKGQLAGTLGVYDKISPDGGYLPFDPENRQLLYTMAGVIVNAIENALTYQQVEDLAEKNERMVRNLTALQEISQGLLTTVQEDRLMEIILQGLILDQGLGFDRAFILTMDEASQTLRGRRGARRREGASPEDGLKKLLLEPPEVLPLDDWEIPLRADQGPLALALLRKQSYHHHSLKEPGVPPGLKGKYAAQDFFVVPLIVKDRATGVILVDNEPSGRPLEAEPIHVLQMLATEAALVLENAHLYSTIDANNRELLLMRERMLESDRLAALSSLASGMAHEIRNPLVSIGGFARRIAKLVEPNSPLRGYVEVIQEEVTRLEKLLREILDFTGENLSYYGDHELAKLIDDTLILVQRDLEASKIKVVKDLAPLPRLHCDDRQMKQVIYNLFQNAIQAMPNGGTLTIRTYAVEKPDGLYEALAVADTGGGIPMEVLHNIFNPFFSTKDYGTGLGLAIAQRIVSRHYGHIEVNNEIGKGVTFIVTLPVAKYCLVKDTGQEAVPASVLKVPKGGWR
jgi:two-component system, NtrC family, sensor histidine kinase HydH